MSAGRGLEQAVLPYGRQSIDESDVAAVVGQLRDDWLTQGPRVEDFEAAICEATGAAHAVAVSSGTAALHVAALALGVGPGTSGVTSAITFVASANCIAYAGGRPAFADVDPATALVDPDSLDRRCRELSDAGTPVRLVVPVDFSGQAADLPAIRDVARRHGAAVLEDAAHSLGGTYEAQGATHRCGGCAHADAAVLSFHPVKTITTAEGGAVTTQDPELARRMRELRTHGITKDPERLRADEGPWYHEQQDLGFNYRLTDLQCALGVSQMRRLDEFVARRRALAARYDAAISGGPLASELVPLARRPGTASAHHLYVIRLLPREGEDRSGVARRRRTLFEALVEHRILPQVHYIPVPRQPWYRERWSTCPERFPGAETYYAGCLSLPLFPSMNDADVDRVVDRLEWSLGAE